MDLVEDSVVPYPDAPLVSTPAEPAASRGTSILAEITNGCIYAALNLRWQSGHLLLYLAGNLYRIGMLVAGNLALSDLSHVLFPGDDLFLIPLDGRLCSPGGL